MKKFFILILFFLASYPSLALSERKNEIYLLEGNYFLEANYYLEKNKEEIKQIDLVSLTYMNGEIVMKNEEKENYPIIGKIKNNIFTATLKDAKGLVKFNGQVLDNSRIEGEMSGDDNKGQNKLKGIFLLYPAN